MWLGETLEPMNEEHGDAASFYHDPSVDAERRETLRLVAAGFGFLVIFVGYIIGTYATWEATCSMGWGKTMDADPSSFLGRFCLGETAYKDDDHFILWVAPLMSYLVLASRWVGGRSARWIVAAVLVSGTLAFLYYSPFLFLPG